MKKVFFFVCLFFAAEVSAADITVTKTAEQLGTQYGWKSGGFYGTFQLDNVVTFTAEQPETELKNGYYSPDSPRDWRIYQARNNGKFTVSVRSGYKIRSLNFSYNTSKSGVLSLVAGTEVASESQVVSGQTLVVDSSCITLYAGNTGTGTAGQVKLYQFQVTYYSDDTTAVVERFSGVVQPGCNEQEVSWKGDYADWQVLNVRRGAKDTLNGGVQGTWSKSTGYLKSTNAEGGIKRLRFSWRQFVTTETDLVLAIAAGDQWQDTTQIRSIATQAASKDYQYDTLLQCKQNVQLSFTNLSQISNQDRFLLGDIYITPYLYIPAASRVIELNQAVGRFDLKKIVQNNSEGEEPVYTIVSDGTDGATIAGSVVDFSTASQTGDIVVRASLNEGKVYVTATLHITVVEVGDVFTETFSNCTMTKQSGSTYVVGDNGVFGWNFTHFARDTTDTIEGMQGTRIGYNGSVAMNGVQEGGVKSLSFSWRARISTQPVHFVVKVDGQPYDFKCTAEESMGEVRTYYNSFSVNHNTAIAVAVGAKETTQQAEIVLGKVEITPYMLFMTKQDTVLLEEAKEYDLSQVLINNTKDEPVYSILSDETGVANLEGSVLNLSQASKSGRVRVQATWKEIATTITILAQSALTDLSECSAESVNRFTKIVKDGRLYIVKDGVVYTPQGVRL